MLRLVSRIKFFEGDTETLKTEFTFVNNVEIISTWDSLTDKCVITTGQNGFSVLNGIKIGNNTDSAATAGGGSIRYNTGLEFSNATNWYNTVAIIKGDTKTTAAAPYTNDGFITVTIEGVVYKLMTTA